MVSIIMPSYNKVNFVKDAIDSVLAQQSSLWELIIIDDDSTDGTAEICKEFAEHHKKIRVYEKKDFGGLKGASVSRNIGASVASYKYLMFLDADDIISQGCINDRIDFANENPEANFLVFPMNSFEKRPGDKENIWKLNCKKRTYLSDFLRHDIPWSISSVLWKKCFFRSVGGFDVVFPRMQDIELHTRAVIHDDFRMKIFCGQNPDFFYRVRDEDRASERVDVLGRFEEGVLMYIEKCLNEINDVIILKNLRGTMFAFIQQLFRANKLLGKEKFLEKKRGAINNFSSFKIWGVGQQVILTLYSFLFFVGMHRVRGFDKVFKYLFIRL